MRIDRIGERFGMLTVTEPTQRVLSSGRKMPAWVLRCDCGREVVAMTTNLTKGKHQSCGCAPRGKLEGEAWSKWPEYSVWRQMVQRCTLSTSPNYPWYGGRDIRVCARWTVGEFGKTGFECFIEDMGRRPEGMTLDRADPDGNYEPNNCRWATWTEQQNNRGNNRFLEAAGRRLTVSQWAHQTQISPHTISDRLKRGWTAEQAVGIAPRPAGPARRPNRTLRAAAAVFAMMLCAPALAHSPNGHWMYPEWCCGGDPSGLIPGGDCARVTDDAVRETQGGYSVTIAPGTHPMVPHGARPVVGFVPHGDPRIQPSGDEHRHVCIVGGRVYCVFIAPGGV
jgi:hypothetical protein